MLLLRYVDGSNTGTPVAVKMKSIVLARSAKEKNERVFWRFFTFGMRQEDPPPKSRDLIGWGDS
jgi:hypothetical protein